MRTLIAILAASFVAALVVSVVSPGQSSGSAAVATKGVHWTPVTFTNHISIVDDWQETVLKSKLAGCEKGANVVSEPGVLPPIGDQIVFGGTKTVSCEGGDFTYEYRAFQGPGPRPTYLWGSWTITGGSGPYEKMIGGGTIDSVYEFDAAGNYTGIVDKYDGMIWLPCCTEAAERRPDGWGLVANERTPTAVPATLPVTHGPSGSAPWL